MNSKECRASAAFSLVAFFLAAPEALAGASGAISRPNAAAAGAMAETISTSAEDRPSISVGVEGLLDFIAERRGKDAAGALAAMRKPTELGPFLTSKYGTDAYEEALEAFAAWDKADKGPGWKAEKVERLETEHFVLVTMPGTAAHRDREYVARLVERLAGGIEAAIAPAGALRARLERNLGAARSKKVEIALPPNSKAFGRSGSAGEVSYGLTVSGSDLVTTVSIKLPYYNALSTATLASEIAHLIDVFCKFDSRAAPPLPDEGLRGEEADRVRQAFSKWAQSTFEEIIPYEKGFGEGFAEYVADRVCPLRRAFFGDPDAFLARKRVRPDKDILERQAPTADRLAKSVLSIERDSFVSFLVERYGLPRFLDFYMSVPLEEKRFKKVFGKSFAEVQADWRSTLGS